jgi:hypothetical protein
MAYFNQLINLHGTGHNKMHTAVRLVIQPSWNRAKTATKDFK